MIPLKLELKNFLSYGDVVQTIDFHNHGLICLSGKNGNGKSALLDAITWAVWGQARKVGGISKADEGLLRLGQTRMMVALTFGFSEKTYRVRREFSKTYGKPHAALDFEVLDDASSVYRSLTDKTIRATQDVIERTLNLDYETFINSAFLRQGQSNEFSKKTARERKQILANILGLNTYDALQQHAVAESKRFELQVVAQRQLLTHLETELQQEPVLHETRDLLTKNLEETGIELAVVQKILSQAERLAQQYEEQEKMRIFLQTEHAAVHQRFVGTVEQLLDARRMWHELRALLRNQPTPQELEQRRKDVVLKKKEQAGLAIKLVDLEQQRNTTVQQAQAKLFVLEQEHARVTQQAKLLVETLTMTLQQRLQDGVRLQAEHKDLAQKIAVLNKHIADGDLSLQQEEKFQGLFSAAKVQFDKRKAFYQNYVHVGNVLKNDLKDLEPKIKLLACKDNAACPLCTQPLSLTAQQNVVAGLGEREKFLTHRLNRIAELLKNLKMLLVAQHEACSSMEKQAIVYAQLHAALREKRQQRDDFVINLQVLTQEIGVIESTGRVITEQLKLAETALQELIKKNGLLIQDPEYVAMITRSAMLDQEIDAIKKSQSSFESADAMLTQLEVLQEAASNRTGYEHRLMALREKISEMIQALRMLKQQRNAYDETLRNMQVIDHADLAATLIVQRAKKEELAALQAHQTHELGSVANSIKRLVACRIDIEQKRLAVTQLQDEREDFEQLAVAFGKNGIQALLIEEAIPEIEQEANALLAKLTDNQAQIFIESLRDLKSGGVKETLEIKVADAAGIRPYEMFSGGEAFRVDFALRIAISKLLARRAGTALQTLIIDEGFGSQDEEGLSRIMNALYAIQHDFSKIIIVSHLNEFKENFPVHFVVDKTSAGSTVTIEERG